MFEAILEILKLFNGYWLWALAFWVILIMYFYNINSFIKTQTDQLEILTKSFTESIDAIITKIDKISSWIWKTKLNKPQRTTVFKCVLHEHIDRKIDFAVELLERNHIKERQKQVKDLLKNEFFRITMEEADKLSSFDTEVWDMGKILMWIDFDEFMWKVYEIFFSEQDIIAKEKDLRSMMEWYVNNLIVAIES